MINLEEHTALASKYVFKTSMLRSDLSNYGNAHIVVKGTIAVTRPNNNVYDKKLAFKNNAPINSCITKLNNTLIDNAEDLDIVMSMHNLIEYSKNYRKTTGSLRNYCKDEPNSGSDGVGNSRINYSIKDSKSFDHKTSITGKLVGNNVEKEKVEIVVSLKYLSNFRGTLDMPLINCDVFLTLTWSENCVLTSNAYRRAVATQGGNPAVGGINNPTGAAFKITDCKLYVPVVTLTANKLLEQVKTAFKRTIKWNKYRSQMSNQTRNNNLNYLIDPTFTNVNRLLALSFESEDDRTSFSKHYVPSDEVKDFNVLTDGKPSFEIPVKNKEEANEAITERNKNNDYRTGNLLGYEYFPKYYKLIAIGLSK